MYFDATFCVIKAYAVLLPEGPNEAYKPRLQADGKYQSRESGLVAWRCQWGSRMLPSPPV